MIWNYMRCLLPVIPRWRNHRGDVSGSLSGVLAGAGLVNEVVGGPGSGELHAALLQLLGGGGVLVLVAFDRLVVDQMRDIEEHLP